MQNKIS